MTGPGQILLVDDNEYDNVYHEIVLRKVGFEGEILAFEGGQSLLDHLQAQPPIATTFIFLDINMPGLNGFEVALAAQPLLEGRPAVIVVMLTSSGSPNDRERASAIPVVGGFLTKPLTVDAARALLQHAP